MKAFSLSTQDTDVELGQPVLHSEFEDSQSFTEKSCFKTPKPKPNNQTKNTKLHLNYIQLHIWNKKTDEH